MKLALPYVPQHYHVFRTSLCCILAPDKGLVSLGSPRRVEIRRTSGGKRGILKQGEMHY